MPADFEPHPPAGSIDRHNRSTPSEIEDVTSIPGSLLVDSLDDLPFPLGKRELVAAAGHRQLRFPSGRAVALADLLAGVRRELFESIIDVVEALRHPAETG